MIREGTATGKRGIQDRRHISQSGPGNRFGGSICQPGAYCIVQGLDIAVKSGFGDVAQLGERRVRNAEVGSSILLVSTTTTRAQSTGSVSFQTLNPLHCHFLKKPEFWQTSADRTMSVSHSLKRCAPCTTPQCRPASLMPWLALSLNNFLGFFGFNDLHRAITSFARQRHYRPRVCGCSKDRPRIFRGWQCRLSRLSDRRQGWPSWLYPDPRHRSTHGAIAWRATSLTGLSATGDREVGRSESGGQSALRKPAIALLAARKWNLGGVQSLGGRYITFLRRSGRGVESHSRNRLRAICV